MQMFRSLEVSRVVVACNAAGTVLHRVEVPSLCVSGVIAPALRRLGRERYPRVGIIGGRRTVRSQAYAAPLRRMGAQVQQRVAQPLSALIEAGQAGTPETLALLRAIVAPLQKTDCLVLACTHYIALEPALRTLLPAAMPLIDPAAEAWREVRRELPPPLPRQGIHRFYTTGDPAAMQAQAAAVFGVHADVHRL
jgi:glutamate racemase